jgi:N-acetylneuraminic acid mutarotase
MMALTKVFFFLLGTASFAASSILTRQAKSGTWKTLAPVPIGAFHEESTVAISDTKIAIIGGILQQGGMTDYLGIYDIPSNTWTPGTRVPVPINHANAAVVGGKIYVLGGMTGASWAGDVRSWVYDPNTKVWTALTPMPRGEGRGSAAMGVYNGTIWMAGGKTSGTGGVSVDTVSAYHVATNAWIDVPAAAKHIPGARDHGGGAVIGTKFYQLGGSLDGIPNRKDTVFILDLENVSAGWKTANGKMPTPRRGLAVAAIGTKIYTFGGEGNPNTTSKGVFDSVEVYDTVTDSWEVLAPMPLPRHGTYAVAIGGVIYIPGGGTESGTPATAAFTAYYPPE